MKRIFTRLSLLLMLAAMSSAAQAQKKLMHYWHFNSFTGLSSAVVPSTTTLVPYRADFTTNDTNKVKVAWLTIPGTSASYKTYWDASAGDTVNLRNGATAGNCLRLRNPSDSMQLQFYIPSTKYKNITIHYEIQKSSASNGAVNNWFSYSIDSGANWITTGLSTTSYTVTNYSGGTPPWPLSPATVSISNVQAFNNPKLVFRIRFDGSGSTGTSGNDRIDNFSVEGDSIVPVISNTAGLSPFSASENQYSTEQSISVSAVDLNDTLHIQAPANFKLSLSASGTYSGSLFLMPDSAGSVTSTPVYIRFYPPDTGTFSGNMVLSSNQATTRTIGLSGSTLPLPVIAVSGLPLSAFGSTQPGQFSAWQKLVISAVNLSDTLKMSCNAPFKIALDTTSTPTTTIKLIGDTLNKSLYVFFNPSAFGSFSDTLRISSGGANSFAIYLSGTSIPKPQFSIGGIPVSLFSNIVAGKNSAPKTITVNGSNLTASVNLQVNSPYKIATDTLNYQNSLNLTPVSGALNKTVYIRFSPSQLGSVNDSLVISSSDTGTIKVPLSGTTYDPFAGMKVIYMQDFSAISNSNPPAGWTMSDTALWSFTTSNASTNYAYVSGGTNLRFDNAESAAPTTAYATLSGQINTTFLKDIKVIWAVRRTNNFLNGIINGQAYIQYSTNGTQWDTLYYPAEANNSALWTYVNNDIPISLPPSCSRKSNVQLRWLFTSLGTGSSGTYRIDDVRVFGTDDSSAINSVTTNSYVTDFKVYPMPFYGEIFIELQSDKISDAKLLLTDLNGRIVHNSHHEMKQGTNKIRLNDDRLKAGMYFLTIEMNGKRSTTKVVKQD